MSMVFERAAQQHRHQGYIILTIIIICIASVFAILRTATIPDVSVLVPGANETKMTPIHYDDMR